MAAQAHMEKGEMAKQHDAGDHLQPTIVQKPLDRGGMGGAADQVAGTAAYRLEIAHNALQSTAASFK
eukprot:1695733-Pyramimonas_sp.AAC.1